MRAHFPEQQLVIEPSSTIEAPVSGYVSGYPPKLEKVVLEKFRMPHKRPLAISEHSH